MAIGVKSIQEPLYVFGNSAIEAIFLDQGEYYFGTMSPSYRQPLVHKAVLLGLSALNTVRNH